MERLVYVLAGVSLVVLHITLCFFLRFRARRLLWWCLPFSLVLSLTYVLSIWYTSYRHDGLPYSGLRGDASFSISYINNVINGNYFGDFYDKHVPSHYPPLYFWLLGSVAKLTGTDAISAWIAAPAVVLAGLPFLVYWVGRGIGGARMGFYTLFAFFALGSAITSYVFPRREFPPMNWGIHKPYELVAGVVALAWLVDIIHATEADQETKGYQYTAIARQGVIGAIVFLLYYPWFGITAVALLSLLLLDYIRDRSPLFWKLRHILSLSLVSLVLAAPFWLPYVSALVQSESDPNHGWRYIWPGFFDVTRVTIGLGYCGTLFILGVYGILGNWRKNRIARGIGVLVALLYCWFLSLYITWPLIHTNFLSEKAAMLIFVSMSFATGFALESLRQRPGLGPLLASPFLLSLCSLVLLPTFIQWNTRTDERLARASGIFPIQVRELVQRVGGTHTDVTALASPALAYELPAVSRIRLFLSPNIFFSNPLARFEHRKALVEDLNRLESSALRRRLADLGIGLVILDKGTDGNLTLSINKSSVRNSIFDTESDYFSFVRMIFTRAQFSPRDFAQILEDDQVVAFLVREVAAGS